MSSREEKNVNTNAESDAYGIDAVTELSAEEIEKLLAESAGVYSEKNAEDAFAGDVLEMLEETGDNSDDNLRDIQDMLKRADQNEAIDTSPVEDREQQSPVDQLLADIEEGASKEDPKPIDAKTRKAQEKQRKAQEKLQMKQEKAKEAAEKKAKREAAKAEKSARRGNKKRNKAQDLETGEAKTEETEEIQEYDLLQDKDLLDSIVSNAGNLGREKSEASSEKFNINQLGPEFDAAKEREKTLESERTKEKGVEAEKEDIAESGIMELDMNEIDAFIPDISSEPKEETPKPKSGFMSKIIKMLTEEEEPENEDLMISEENQEILSELDKEKNQGGKGKKSQKAKKPAKKKEKKKKAPKPAKPKKPKKVKEKEAYVPGKKITFKKALPILLLGATVGAVVFIFVNLVSDFSVKQEAEEAYKNGDYETCYRQLSGRKLSQEQAQMYGKAESILYMEQEVRKFDIVLKNGTEVQALDSLLQTVESYPAIHTYAAECQALPEVEEIYGRILGILFERYGITEEQAKEIAAIGSSIEYTRIVTAVAEGKGYSAPDAIQPPAEDMDGEPDVQPGDDGMSEVQPEDGVDTLPDELPEEAEWEGGNFIDNDTT